jgi:hypothetical protein
MLEGGLKYSVLKDDIRRKSRSDWNAKPLWPVGVLIALALVAAAGLRLNRKP